MNALSEFFANGQNRREWLDRKTNALSDAAAYYLGPTGIPQKINALAGLAQYTDAGDMVEAADASRALWNDPTIANFGRYGTAAAAMMLPAVTARAINDGVDVAGDLARFGADESGAIRVWHGSPHDFDRFSMDKIGTGEGAQAYGHGLYFAESEDVARNYRSALAQGMGDDNLRAAGAADGDLRAMRQFTQSAVDADTALRDWLHWIGKKETPELREAFMRDWSGRNDGRLYEVDINADPDDFLDWDRPLSEQPQRVREWALDNVPVKGWQGDTVPVRQVWDQWSEAGMDPTAIPELPRTGQDLYHAVASTRTPRETGKVRLGANDTSTRLREAGIPGIRYLDAGSRGAGDGSRNYVVFDENLVQIVKKYGIAGAAAVLGLSQAEVAQAMEQRQPVAQTPPRLD